MRKKVIKPSEKFAKVFQFDWEASDDTSQDLNPLYEGSVTCDSWVRLPCYSCVRLPCCSCVRATRVSALLVCPPAVLLVRPRYSCVRASRVSACRATRVSALLVCPPAVLPVCPPAVPPVCPRYSCARLPCYPCARLPCHPCVRATRAPAWRATRVSACARLNPLPPQVQPADEHQPPFRAWVHRRPRHARPAPRKFLQQGDFLCSGASADCLANYRLQQWYWHCSGASACAALPLPLLKLVVRWALRSSATHPLLEASPHANRPPPPHPPCDRSSAR